MTAKTAFATLAIVAGVAAAFQAAVNSALARSIGFGAALVVNALLVLLGSVGLWAATGATTTFTAPGTPWTLYLGGLLGFVIVGSLAFVFPKIGGAYAISLMVGGQCIAALLVDHYGFLGMPREPLSLPRVIGIALVAAGVAVVRGWRAP